MIQNLFFPFNSPQAGGEFGSMCFVVSYAGTTETVTRAVFRTRAIYVIMWTGHGYFPFLHDLRAKVQKKSDIHKDSTQKTPRELIFHPETTQKIGNSTLNHPKSNGKSSGKSNGKSTPKSSPKVHQKDRRKVRRKVRRKSTLKCTMKSTMTIKRGGWKSEG